MSRHVISQAIVLHHQPTGEIHANLTLLTKDLGMVRATAHGVRGAKSGLRPKVQTYSLVNAFLFEDSQKQRFKLTDAEVLEDFFALRENLAALYHAAAIAELLKRTPLEAGDAWAFPLCLLALECLSERPTAAGVPLVTLQFLWRYLGFLGCRPDPGRCAASGSRLEPDEAVRYRADLGGFTAEAACPGAIPAAAMEWLRYTGRIGFEAACQVGLEPEGRNLLLRLCLDLAAEQIGGRLQSLQGQEFLFFS
jgi:DNA repair protein RecO (recombination protein O)